jgi:hypothetical protein
MDVHLSPLVYDHVDELPYPDSMTKFNIPTLLISVDKADHPTSN